jgi:hypothetical protein
MPKGNFAVVIFNEHLGEPQEWWPAGYTAVGNKTSIKKFKVPGLPVDTGYLITKVYDVQSTDHRIMINGINVAAIDATQSLSWQDGVDVIPMGILKHGDNTVQIIKANGEASLRVKHMIIHWKEVDDPIL